VTKQEVLKAVEEQGINLIRHVFVGFDGISRGRVLLKESLPSSLESGTGITTSVQEFNNLDELVPGGSGPVGEVILVPDPDTFTILPNTENSAMMLCDFQTYEKKPWALCPRTFLKRILRQVEEMGYCAQCAIEDEFYLFELDGDEVRPFDEELYSSVGGMNTADEIASEMITCLQAMGIPVQKYHPEYGPGQQEIVVGHTNPLKAADNQVMLKDAIKGVAVNNGLVASFMPKPIGNKSGCGAHLHIGFCDESGKNLFYDQKDRNQLSLVGYHFIGGVLKHLSGLLAVTASTVNSYKRLQPGNWASAFTCYGYQNREAAVRIVGSRDSLHLELKPMDPCCNPYLATGCVLAAGLDGIANNIDPGDTGAETDPQLIDPEARRRRGIRRFPENLSYALDELSRDDFLLSIMGDEFSQAYLRTKRSEWDAYAAHVTDWEIKHYLTVF
jgi:glutamine synthetase